MRSNSADSRVSPKVVSESAAMAISLFLRTTTRVVMAQAVKSRAALVRESDGGCKRNAGLYRERADRQHRHRRQHRRGPVRERPSPERLDGTGRRGKFRLVQEIPRPHERREWIRRQRFGSGLLGELFAASIDCDRMMQIHRRAQPERALQPDLSRRRCQKIRATNDVRDALRRVIDDHRELVREHAIGALDDEVAELELELLLLPSAATIAEADRFVAHAQPPRARLASRGGAGSTSSGIDALAPGVRRRALEFLDG